MSMIVFFNGRFVPEALAVVPIFDRSFLYGDGLFETMRVAKGRPFRWAQHMDRLRSGADFLGIKIPFGCKALEKFANELVAQNKMPDALLRLTLSRGVGLRGYSPKGATTPALAMTVHPLPGEAGAASRQWKLRTASFRLPAGEQLAQFKTANKLAQVLARAEADATGADEAVLRNTDGFVVEGASSNLFWIHEGAVCTAPLATGILAGVTRAVTLEICGGLGAAVREQLITPDELREVEGVFLTLSSLGVVEAVELDGQGLRRSPLTEEIRHGYEGLLSRE
jgi:branched-chain amino acid aminotransferase